MNQKKRSHESLLKYPLRWESLLLIGFVCIIFYFLVFASLFSFVVSEGVPFYALGIFTVYVLSNIFFEFGQEIVARSFLDKHEIPLLSVQSIERGRFFRQLVMTGFFGSVVYGLVQYQLPTVAIAFAAIVVIALPASVSVNAIYEDLYEVMNPRTWVEFVVVTKTSYIGSLLGLALLILIFYWSLRQGLGFFLLVIPFWLYFCLVYFRHLGLVALAHRDILLPEQDFDADKKEIEKHFNDNAAVHDALERAYWGLKEGQVQEAIAIVGPIIRTNDWARFDFVFDFVSAWPTKVPAIHFVKEYLPRLRSEARSIRGLELCAWCLRQDNDFSLEDVELIDYLVNESVSREQFTVAVKLMENFAVQNPQHEKQRAYLFRAADICQDKLHHAEKFQELQLKLSALDD